MQKEGKCLKALSTTLFVSSSAQLFSWEDYVEAVAYGSGGRQHSRCQWIWQHDFAICIANLEQNLHGLWPWLALQERSLVTVGDAERVERESWWAWDEGTTESCLHGVACAYLLVDQLLAELGDFRRANTRETDWSAIQKAWYEKDVAVGLGRNSGALRQESWPSSPTQSQGRYHNAQRCRHEKCRFQHPPALQRTPWGRQQTLRSVCFHGKHAPVCGLDRRLPWPDWQADLASLLSSNVH